MVKSELMGGFSLAGTLGKPKEAAEKLLSTFIAPPESGGYCSLLLSTIHAVWYRSLFLLYVKLFVLVHPISYFPTSSPFSEVKIYKEAEMLRMKNKK